MECAVQRANIAPPQSATLGLHPKHTPTVYTLGSTSTDVRPGITRYLRWHLLRKNQRQPYQSVPFSIPIFMKPMLNVIRRYYSAALSKPMALVGNATADLCSMSE